MTNEMKNVPELRFSEFDGEWEQNYIGSYIKELKMFDTQQGSGFSIATSSRKGLFKQEDYFDGERTFSKNDVLYSIVPPNFITYRHMSDDNIFKFNINSFNENLLVSKEYPVFDVNNQADKKFVFYELNNNINFLKFCIKQKKGGTRTRLYFNVLEKYKTFFPILLEQQKIGNFFSKLDRQIELEEQKLEKLEEQKKGYMQKIFSQELQFKDKITNNFDNWSEFKIKDIISKIESGNRLPKNNLIDGDIPYVIAQTTNNGVYMNISKDTLDYHGNNLKKFKKGSITISIDNPDAMFIQKHDFVTSNVMRVLYNENLSIEAHTFILYSLRKLTQTFNWSVKFSGPIIMDSKIKLPVKLNTNDINWNIVNKIGGFLTKLDFKIYQNTTKVELLKHRK
ncbi:hypothetical protein BUZ05_12370, partial [Staphylococcus gallinarum]|uniref:restriction endonuclease subunit S n=1 Tax=Staphylococcus gallinarum TaxID=1293 RepID=UPI000D3FA84B